MASQWYADAPPATLPGGAPAPWATQELPTEPVPAAQEAPAGPSEPVEAPEVPEATEPPQETQEAPETAARAALPEEPAEDPAAEDPVHADPVPAARGRRTGDGGRRGTRPPARTRTRP